MMQSSISKYLKFIPFENFTLWDVKRYYFKGNHKFNNVVTLQDILIPYKKAVSKEELIRNKWRIISKINFDGELFLRDFEEVYSYKGNVNLVPDNAIIYSKINVKHGCLYFHEKGQIPFGVSTEYPTFKFDESKISGKFLHKVLRCSSFKKLLDSKTTGISKARVKQNEFLNIQIPLPSLVEQERIMSTYLQKIKIATRTKQSTEILEQEIEKYLLRELGINPFKGIDLKKGLNVVEYVNLTKWSLNYLNRENTYDFENSKFKTEKIGNLLKTFEGGKTPSKSRADFWDGNIFWTSPKDFKGKRIIVSAEDKITQLAVKEAGMKVFPKGVLVSVFRSGILQHSFPTAITEIETAINQDLKAYTFKENIIEIYYYLHFVHAFKKHILTLASKKSATVESINTEDFFEIKIPVPPILKQKEIIKNVNNLKKHIDNLILESAIEIGEAEQEFEKSIFN